MSIVEDGYHPACLYLVLLSFNPCLLDMPILFFNNLFVVLVLLLDQRYLLLVVNIQLRDSLAQRTLIALELAHNSLHLN